MCKKVITDSKGRRITLTADSFFSKVTAFYENQKIGSFDFDERDDGINYWLIVTNMHLEDMPNFVRCGIGTNIVDWVEESTGHFVDFGSNDGYKSEDGSHLTGNGPSFAQHIRNRRRLNKI